MRTIIISFVLLSLISAPVLAQPNMEGMDIPPLMSYDGFRIFFDDSVTWDFGGAIPYPWLWFWQTEPLIDAYLVLTHPTAAQLGGFRIRSQMVGDHVITGWEVLGAPVSVQIVGDEIQVEYDPALAMDDSPVSLIHWGMFNLPVQTVEFFLRPPEGYETPVYFDGAGLDVAGNTLNGAYHNFTAPVAMLNGGVSPVEGSSWGSVKALYR